ncbi:uncharacterized protein LOC113866677 [Abrus precatorius]|uniref:Uncharacterized protein LOC113866677 n=1 Tax=Abrus precatorius TaxID=3816 RepID=A0A8B8LMY8_ABRPR|nr:uncharacterized protein LOC113866677 [Abrus precatorius]
MACERVDVSILVVDDDDVSLAIVANILNSLEYKVLIANGTHNALETLREFEGFVDLVITELHISGMNGFEFQKLVINEFQIPVIMMSADSRKSVMSKSLENGAAHFILKPFCRDDFKDIWQFAMAARKGTVTTENIEGESTGDKVIVQDVNSSETSSLAKPKRKRKYGQRKNKQMSKEDQSEESSQLAKKQKVVWTTDLHNLFLLAIKQIGMDRAVPKKILEIMNAPNLTRENVASHLQKYRMFLRKVAEKGLVEGLSDRTLRSRFASGLSASLIRDIQTRTAKLRVPAQPYLKRLAHQPENGGKANAVKPFNHVSRNAYVTPHGRSHHQFPNAFHKGLNLMLQNQHVDSWNVSQSRYGSNVGANSTHQKILGSYANPMPYQAKISCNAGAGFPTCGINGRGLMTSTNGLIGGLKYGEPMYQNYVNSMGNHQNFSYGPGNGKTASLNSSNNQPWSTTSIYNPNTNIQLNGGSKMVGNGIKGGFKSTVGAMDSIANNNNFSLINGTSQNAKMNVAPLGHGNFGLSQGGFGIASASKAEDGWSNEFPQTMITNGTKAENSSGFPQFPHQLDDNVEENENLYNNATSIWESKFTHLEDDLADIFTVLDEMNLLNETDENPDASEVLESILSGPRHDVQSLEQSIGAGDVIDNPNEGSLNLPNKSTTCSDKNSNQLEGYDGFGDMEPFDEFLVDDVSSATHSAIDQDWDMELIEALFGDEAN